MAQHLPDVGEESHVQHAIRLVQHEVLEARELRVRLPEVVEQSPGRGDEDVNAAPERVFLRSHPHATKDGCPGYRRMHGQRAQFLKDLRGELTRGCEHECARGAARTIDELVHDGQEERGRLAAPRHGAGEEVTPVERGRDGRFLDGRRAAETGFLHPLEEAGVKLERTERHEKSWS